MKFPRRTFGAATCVAALLALSLSAHEGDPMIFDLRPAYDGPGFRSGVPGVLAGGSAVATQPAFPASGVELLSWMSLPELGNASGGNSCFGYTSPSGREYALIGLRGGTGFVEVSDPGAPVHLTTVPGPASLWRDVRTYQDHAYMVSEGGVGIQVVDLSNIDAGQVQYVGDVTAGGALATHTVFVNEASGYLYRSGGGPNGLRIYDLSNPASPTFVAQWSDRYVHEVTVVSYTSGPYAGREIAFCCGGFNGGFTQTGLSVVDVTDKSNIFVLAHENYSNAGYCHQAWPSEDLQYLYINDEMDENGSNSTRTVVFDISNLSNPVQKPSFFSSTTAIGHNLYVKGDRIFAADYRAGLRVYDNSNPAAPVEVAWFDTWPADDNAAFNSLWNNYPYFQSGIVIGSDIEQGLFVWWPDAPLVDIGYPGGTPESFDPGGDTLTVQLAETAPGTLLAGTPQLHYNLGAGWVSVPLSAQGGDLFSAPIPAQTCGEPINWYVTAKSSNNITWTEPEGGPNFFNVSTAALSIATVQVDDLEAKDGWVVGAADDDATSGKWIWADPLVSSAQPGDDHTPGSGDKCFFTKQGLSGSTPGSHDVDGGKTTLTSPAYDASGLSNPVLAYWRWYSNNKSTPPSTDVFEVQVANSSAGPWVTVETVGPDGPGTEGGWLRHQFALGQYVAPSATVHLRFIASDYGDDSLIEAAVDDIELLDAPCPAGGPAVYCTAKTNSQGCTPAMAFQGGPSASSGAAFDVTASELINNQNGLLFYGFGQAATSFQGGTLCVAAPVTRTSGQNSGGNVPPDDCSGTYTLDFNALIQSGADPLLGVGATVYAQYWGRDTADPTGFGSALTDALGFTILP